MFGSDIHCFLLSNYPEFGGRAFLITAGVALSPLCERTSRECVFCRLGPLKAGVFSLVSCVVRLMLVEQDARMVPRGNMLGDVLEIS